MLWEWLSSLGTGGAALFGALLGALSTYVLREVAEKRRRNRELKGLLRLLYDETEYNDWVITSYRDDPDLVVTPAMPALSTEAWDKTNVRLAQLLKDEELFGDLGQYYAAIRTLKRVIDLTGYPSDYVKRRASGILPSLEEYSVGVRTSLERQL